MAFRLTANSLPYVAFVAVGTASAVAFASRNILFNPHVVLNKSGKQPWNDIDQMTNTKLTSFKPDFWSARADILQPQAAFKSSNPGRGKDVDISNALAAKKKIMARREAERKASEVVA